MLLAPGQRSLDLSALQLPISHAIYKIIPLLILPSQDLLQQAIPHILKLLDNLRRCAVKLTGNHPLLI